MPPLIFLEGISGVGKSTAVEILGAALHSRGVRVLSYLEGDGANPVDLYGCAYLTTKEYCQLQRHHPLCAESIRERSWEHGDYVLVRYQDNKGQHFQGAIHHFLKERESFFRPRSPISASLYTKVYTDLWQSFVSSLGDRAETSAEKTDADTPAYTRRSFAIPAGVPIDIVLLDGCFLYHRMNDLVSNYGAGDEEILDCLLAILDAMHPQRPWVFYLHSQDPAKRLEDARRARGQEPATRTRIREEERRGRRQEAILSRLPVKIARFDVTDGWDAAIQQMLQMAEGVLSGTQVP